MSVRRLYDEQPESFAFTPENLEWARGQIAKYPEGRQTSAVISLLWRAQEQHGSWLPEPAIRVVADMLGMAYIRVLEVATFYTMFNLAPVGRHHVQLCGTVPCAIRGAEELKQVCRKVIGPERHVTGDGALSWIEVECLGACVNAPMAQINADYYEDLTPERFEEILDALRAGREVPPGPQVDRQFSAPIGGPTTLTDPALYAREAAGAVPDPAGVGLRGARVAKPDPHPRAEEEASENPAEKKAQGEAPPGAPTPGETAAAQTSFHGDTGTRPKKGS